MKNAIVVDASIVLKWILNEPDSGKALALLAGWSKKRTRLLAPALLAYEVTNILYQNVRSAKITVDTAKQGLIKVAIAGLNFDFSRDFALSIRAIELAHQYSLLAAYDAHYLALAERENCELWTSDTRMWRAIKGKLSWVHRLDDYIIP